jgi:hypothetical protein
LNSQSVIDDPVVLGGSIRVRTLLFRAYVNLGSGEQWQFYNREAYQLLEELLNLDPVLLRPAPEAGWSVEDCRLANQDYLDALHFTLEWFRGWSPNLLQEMCGVPGDLARTVEARVKSNMVSFCERMLALRAWQDRADFREEVVSWTTVWSTMRTDLTQKLKVGAHPLTKSYFEELARWLTPPIIDEIATAIADNAIESQRTNDRREELRFEFPNMVLRCVVRCRKSLGRKRDDVASIRGTVLDDLRGKGSEGADLNLLYWLFTKWDNTDDAGYGLFMNCVPSLKAQEEQRLPSILLHPFVMLETLTEEERAVIGGASGYEVVEEL